MKYFYNRLKDNKSKTSLKWEKTLLIAIILISSGCTPALKQITGADLELAYASGPVIKSTEYLNVFVTNMSQGCVEFSHDFGLKIYFTQNGSWVETGNMVRYPDPKPIELQPNGGLFDDTAVSLRPTLSGEEITGPITLKATIHGNVCNNPSSVIEKDIPFTVVP
jgi:hypothetical protein